MTDAPFDHVALIGLGLLGSSLAHAIRAHLPDARVKIGRASCRERV